jgi:hypothetical protein
MLVPASIALSAAAAFGLYLVTQTTRPPLEELRAEAPKAKGTVVEAAPVAANQPLAAAPEAKPAAAPSMAAVTPEPVAPSPAPAAPAAMAPVEPEAQEEKAEAEPGPQPVPPPAERPHGPVLKFEPAQVRGGIVSEAVLLAALTKAEPELLACYEKALEQKPKLKGRVIYGFTVRTNGHATNAKRVGGTLHEPGMISCTLKALENARFGKKRKQASQIKLPIQYKRS